MGRSGQIERFRKDSDYEESREKVVGGGRVQMEYRRHVIFAWSILLLLLVLYMNYPLKTQEHYYCGCYVIQTHTNTLLIFVMRTETAFGFLGNQNSATKGGQVILVIGI